MEDNPDFILPEFKHGWAKVNDINLHYVEAGTNSSDPIILLHGFPQSWPTWRYVIPYLMKDHLVIAVDLRGYGDSDKPTGTKGYDKSTMASDIHELIKQLNLENITIVGHDRGARVARRFALDYPDKVVGIGLIDILPMEYLYDELTASEAAKKYWHWTFHLVPDLPEALIQGKEETYLEFLFRRAPGLLSLLQSDGSWEEYLRVWKQPETFRAALSDYRATHEIDLPHYREENAAGKIIKTPTFLLWGENGNLAGQPVLDIWKNTVLHVQGEQLANCGHYVPEEQPEIVSEYILKFISANRASAKRN